MNFNETTGLFENMNSEEREEFDSFDEVPCQNNCGAKCSPDELKLHVPSGLQLCDTCLQEYLDNDAESERTFRLKVEHDGWAGFIAYDEIQGVDFDGDSDGWHSCGSPIGSGATIQEALEAVIELISEKRAEKADPNDDKFVYEILYSWT